MGDGAGRSDVPAISGPVGVVVSRFPKFTETFVVNEILAFERMGISVEILPLLPVEPGPRQPAAEPLVPRAHFANPWGLGAAIALLRVAVTRPRRLLGVIAQLVRDTWKHPPFLVKDLVLLPRVCALALHSERLGLTHLHAHFATHAGFAVWAVGRLTGLPYSIVAHGSDVHRHRAMLPTKVAESAFVATISEFNRAVIEAECGGEAPSVVVVRCGIDASAITPRRQTPDRDVPLLLCVGTLHQVKGQRYAIEAVALLADRGVPVRLELLGDGEDRDELEDLVRSLGVDERVRFAGAVPHTRVLERYRDADVVVVPSVPSDDGRREGIPTVIMEAMASGAPVVASDLSGIPELIEHEQTGLLAAPGDSVDLASAIERLRDDRELSERCARLGRARVLDDYDVSKTAATMAGLIARGGVRPDVGPRRDRAATR